MSFSRADYERHCKDGGRYRGGTVWKRSGSQHGANNEKRHHPRPTHPRRKTNLRSYDDGTEENTDVPLS